MKSLAPLACSLAIFQTLGAGSTIPRYFQTAPVTRYYLLPSQVEQELGPQLSNTTTIFGPGDSRFDNATVRWDVVAMPRVQVVIEPGQESDIPIIVSINEEYYYRSP
jgi:hypothetical protein